MPDDLAGLDAYTDIVLTGDSFVCGCDRCVQIRQSIHPELVCPKPAMNTTLLPPVRESWTDHLLQNEASMPWGHGCDPEAQKRFLQKETRKPTLLCEVCTWGEAEGSTEFAGADIVVCHACSDALHPVKKTRVFLDRGPVLVRIGGLGLILSSFHPYPLLPAAILALLGGLVAVRDELRMS
jgi:hypothetical protein